MTYNSKILSPETLIKMLIVLRKDLCDGDIKSHRRIKFTVEEMETHSKRIDNFIKKDKT